VVSDDEVVAFAGDVVDEGEWDETSLAEIVGDLEFDVDDDDDTDEALPVVAIVGRPNVGKSTLVNRILGRREAVVEDVPGVTRDRVAYEAEWSGVRFTLLDTGGYERDAIGMAASIARQAEIAVSMADVVVLVVDARVGALDEDEAVVKVLRRAGKPVLLAANKVDDARTESDAAALWNLGLGEPHPVSALHGRGSGDMLDAILALLPRRLKALVVHVDHVGLRCSADRTLESPRFSTSLPASSV